MERQLKVLGLHKCESLSNVTKRLLSEMSFHGQFLEYKLSELTAIAITFTINLLTDAKLVE